MENASDITRAVLEFSKPNASRCCLAASKRKSKENKPIPVGLLGGAPSVLIQPYHYNMYT